MSDSARCLEAVAVASACHDTGRGYWLSAVFICAMLVSCSAYVYRTVTQDLALFDAFRV